jgi:hypothetical protein
MPSICAIRTSRDDHMRFEAHLSNGHELPVEYGYQRNTPHVSITFAIPKFHKRWTSLGRLQQPSERWLIAVEPDAFADLAHSMMRADPQAAIRAFGNAMQEIEISPVKADQAA